MFYYYLILKQLIVLKLYPNDKSNAKRQTPNAKLKLSIFFLLLLGITSTFFTCQKEHLTLEDLEQNNENKSSIVKTVSARDIPEVMSFIASKSSDYKFLLDDSTTEEGMNRSHEDNLVMTELITDEITQVTNAYQKSNYTFRLIKQSGLDGKYFLNLVVKEYMDTFYLFILKFVPDEIWLSTHSLTKDLGDYTGMVYFYSDEGIYIAKVTMSNGNATASERHPCDDPEDEDQNDYPDDGNDGGFGGDCEFYWEDPDGDTWDNYPDDGDNVQEVYFVINCSGETGDKSMNEFLRHPCSGSGGSVGGGSSCTNVGTCEAPLQFNQDCECKPLEEIENNVVAVNPAKDGDCDTSKEDLKKIFPNASDTDMQTLASVINEYGKDLGVNTKEELQHFLSQAGHETGGFNQGIGAEESLYYTTSSRLKSVYKNYFWQTETDTLNKRNPDDYLNNSSKVANYVYADRMGNGNEASEDGYKYRGRGVFQLTGKTNYSAFKDWYNGKYDPDKDFVTNPEILKNNDTIAIISALWFYKKNVLDKISLDSTTTVKIVTKKVNGGLNGLSDRKEIFQKAKDSITCIQN